MLSRRQASPPPSSLGADSRVTNAKISPRRARPAFPAHSHTKGTPVQVEGESLLLMPPEKALPRHCEHSRSDCQPWVQGWHLWQDGGWGAPMLHGGGVGAAVSGAHGEARGLDSDAGPLGNKCFTLCVCCCRLAPSDRYMASPRLPAGAWGRLAVGAWCVCTEESHTDE